MPYRGQCLVHRAQILQAHGAWDEAVGEVDRARLILSDPVHPALGLAFYQLGELYRLRGRAADAERAYRAALEHGREPEPGMALMRLAEGKVAAAAAAVRRMLQESRRTGERVRVRAAAVEILLAAGDLAGRGQPPRSSPAPPMRSALPCSTPSPTRPSARCCLRRTMRRAPSSYSKSPCGMAGAGMPYEEALARVGIAQACWGWPTGTPRSWSWTPRGRRSSGWAPDRRSPASRGCGGRRLRPSVLTERECEVLRLVAAGRSNREIADQLVISTHTVARHVQNIFAKAGLSSRAAATAYAYEHDLV